MRKGDRKERTGRMRRSLPFKPSSLGKVSRAKRVTKGVDHRFFLTQHRPVLPSAHAVPLPLMLSPMGKVPNGVRRKGSTIISLLSHSAQRTPSPSHLRISGASCFLPGSGVDNA